MGAVKRTHPNARHKQQDRKQSSRIRQRYAQNNINADSWNLLSLVVDGLIEAMSLICTSAVEAATAIAEFCMNVMEDDEDVKRAVEYIIGQEEQEAIICGEAQIEHSREPDQECKYG